MNMFPRCVKAEISDKATGQTIQARVSTGPSNSLVLTLPNTYKLDLDIPVTVVFLDPSQGLVTCDCSLSTPVFSGERGFLSYRCRVLERLSQVQRREDVKIPLSAQTEVSLASTGSRAFAQIKDISAGGVFLFTPLVAQKGDRLNFTFSTPEGSIPLTAEILRVESRMERGRLVRGYGCRFVRLNSQQEANLRSYVFKEERKLHKLRQP